MRTMIYVPIIHSIADMGSMAEELRNISVSVFGESEWQKHIDNVDGYWDTIEKCFQNIENAVQGLKIYQDGMFVDGEAALKILEEGVRAGSKNSEIISKLTDRGAILMKTENFNMVKAEYNGLQSVIKSKNKALKLILLFKYKISKPFFLIRRDRYIAHTIAETLWESETGLLFIGASHKIMKRLPKDIKVIDLNHWQRQATSPEIT